MILEFKYLTMGFHLYIAWNQWVLYNLSHWTNHVVIGYITNRNAGAIRMTTIGSTCHLGGYYLSHWCPIFYTRFIHAAATRESVRIADLQIGCRSLTWWRHLMETFSAPLALCAGNSPITSEFPSQRPVTRRFDVFIDLRLNKQSSN